MEVTAWGTVQYNTYIHWNKLWIFERVELFSIHMFGHNPIHTNEEKDNDKDDESNDDFSIY